MMATHRITMPDWMRGREPRTIIWDDEAGTVVGDHYELTYIRERFEAPKPVTIGGPWGMWDLVDPAHDPVEFLTLLADVYYPIIIPPLRETLPAVFDGLVVPAPRDGENHGEDFAN